MRKTHENDNFQNYPMLFSRKIKTTIWGSYSLYGEPDLAKNAEKNPDLPKIGEIWNFCDSNIYVLNGPMKLCAMREIFETAPPSFFGPRYYGHYKEKGAFPLLCKIIDANDRLSVQVHPDDSRAHDLEGAPSGKAEMWYILEAAPDAEIIIGFSGKINENEFRSHLDDHSFVDYLNHVKVKKGDTFLIPAGRIHSIGAGVIIAEIQQNCDITYRVYDYGRTDSSGNLRQLHVDKAIKCIDFADILPNEIEAVTAFERSGAVLSLLAACHYFTVIMHEIEGGRYSYHNAIPVVSIFMNTGPDVFINYNGSRERFSSYSTLLVPASCENVEFTLCADRPENACGNATTTGGIKLIQSYHLPDRLENARILKGFFGAAPGLSQFDI